MSDLVRILFGVVMIVLFINLLPIIGSIAVILLAITLIANLIGFFTQKKRRNNHYSSTQQYYEEPNIENENIHFESYGRVNPDVIDVEYTEKEEKQRGII